MTDAPKSPSTSARLVRALARIATRSGLLAAAAVIGLAGVAAAAMGAPVPLVDGIIGDDPPGDIELDEEASGDTDDSTEIVLNPVAEAARSDCFRQSTDDETETVPDTDGDPAGAENETGEEPDGYECGDQDFDNHGQFVASVAQDRNVERRTTDDETDEGDGTDEGQETESPESDESDAAGDDEADDGDADDDESDESDGNENPVAEAARSDCFKPGTGDVTDTTDDGDEGETDEAGESEADDDTGDPSGPADDYDCGDQDFDNHGQFVASVAHERNLERFEQRCAQAEGQRAERCLARLGDKTERWATDDGEPGDGTDEDQDSEDPDDEVEKNDDATSFDPALWGNNGNGNQGNGNGNGNHGNGGNGNQGNGNGNQGNGK